ncbi:hypothetical protein QLH32_02470 [Acinetobacter corruptisaponis]|uniref:Uncharacterized protein n=1 Tax=Acinetobacter corruptisaponis TaxID=3045147 RepID=A0ABY8S5X2_9GAMM|nr:hypothetical protein [Acinetobacter sp. KCTC 92772]WHP06349.1 hypothetical protein QLH32_02470 [Acinetobacter sp. KCTC 92772]
MNAKVDFDALTPKQKDKTADDYLWDAQCRLEALGGMLLRTVVSYEQRNLSEMGTKVLFTLNTCLAEYAVEDIESAMGLSSSPHLQRTYQKALGILTALVEASNLDLAKTYTCTLLHGLFTITELLNEEIGTITL